MKVTKLIDKAERYINSDERKRKEKRKCLKHVMKKLRKYEQELNTRLEQERDEEKRKRLEKHILLAHAQRKKGLKMLDQLKKKKKKRQSVDRESK